MHPTSITGFVLILIVALLLFGPSKLPELGKAFGRTLREFKNGAKELMPDKEPTLREVLSDDDVRMTADASRQIQVPK
ncbi:twin-arginine translocase TatA/TatE family subunit [Cohnella hashimotonis]|uniref:Sec-independent protein translocase protein TatA n=1 Tax=Cohnella hashimotonis TaxID=2826895 RepID=A0ABT6TUT1_9BACL|nr:twin-arginine translocase TatA/TatE family subunit [Cohnella hashimotonis]MDI4649542.1 twin-arginine translocase TatA/TatE family subunit [Cohnella hashimotonis]